MLRLLGQIKLVLEPALFLAGGIFFGYPHEPVLVTLEKWMVSSTPSQRSLKELSRKVAGSRDLMNLIFQLSFNPKKLSRRVPKRSKSPSFSVETHQRSGGQHLHQPAAPPGIPHGGRYPGTLGGVSWDLSVPAPCVQYLPTFTYILPSGKLT